MIAMVLFLYLDLHTGKSEIVYITPSPPGLVQSQPYLSLNQLATNTSWLESNTLFFLPGIHRLSSEISLSNISYISLVSDSSLRQPQSLIACQRNTSFTFHNVSHVRVSGLKLLGCKLSVVLVKQLSVENSIFQGVNDSGTALEIIASNANITNSSFIFNRIGRCQRKINTPKNSMYVLVGGAIYALGLNRYKNNNITIVGSRFESNGAEIGGAMVAVHCKMTILNTTFINNHVAVANTTIKETLCHECGTVMADYKSTHFQTLSNFIILKSYSPSATFYSSGGAISLLKSNLTIASCVFGNNTNGNGSGGVLVIEEDCMVQIYNSKFYNSHVEGIGGVLVALSNCYVIIDNCTIFNSSAYDGGVVVIWESHLTIKNSVLRGNTARDNGGVIASVTNCHLKVTSSRFVDNKADYGGVLFAINNLFAYFEGSDTLFSMNKATTFGGAVYSFQSVLTFNGTCIFKDNEANVGGAIYAAESNKFNIYKEVIVTSNIASTIGGGLYLYHSILNCHEESTFNILGNRANHSGGGIYVANSFIAIYHNRSSPVESSVHFVNNVAELGGGICFESSAQLRIYKSGAILAQSGKTRQVYFDSNSADYGKAIYVIDETYFDVCLKNTYSNNECFLQVISTETTLNHHYDPISVEFATNNHSQIGGSTAIYGGLLDRCTPNNFAEITTINRPKVINIDGVTYLKNISNLNDTSSIASAPARLCFCTKFDGKPDCSYTPPQVNVIKGERFNISLVAVDQVNYTIQNVIIHSSLGSPQSGLGYGQIAQKTANACTNLNFTISSPHSHEELILYAEGPCRNVSRSQSRVSIVFQPCNCPKIGFQPKYNEPEAITCECICDSRLYPYITGNECNYQSGLLTRKSNFWITYVDIPKAASSGYVIYPNCPLDYCLPNVPVNLNIANGSADSQCARNRSGTLCGACQQNLSLSLGSSLCIQCSSVWYKTFPTMLIVAIVIGIILVILLMVLNLTVAVGTLNGLIFYANIVGANGDTMISSSAKFPSLFVSWLNLEVGFDVCFFEGMDTYWKTWLQLAFPSYVILLVVLIIVISDHSIKFSRLLAKRNPVATLATLILLSYTMYLRTVIAVLSVATLNYPDGSTRWVWLHDGTVEYLRGKHIVLFVVAMFILIIGITYTALVFFWPWLLHHQNKFVFKWARSQKLHHFMAPYHAPYNINHRFWTGLLLFARVALYLVFALNVSGDPGVNLLAITVTVGAIMFLKASVGKIYQNHVIDWIEMTCYSNATLFSAVQLYLLKADNQQAIDATAYVSGVILMMLFLIAILYHMWRECCAQCLKKYNLREINSILRKNLENLSNYPPVNNNMATPTFSVLEGSTPCSTSQPLATNADSNKQVCKPNVSNEIESDDNVSTDTTPLLAVNY